MPDFTLTGKDGATYDITAPDAAAAMDAISKMKGGAAPDAPPVNVAEDVVKSAGTGLARGVANIPGLPGDVMSLFQSGAQAGLEGAEKLFGYKRTPEQEAAKQEALKKAQVGRMPTSQDIRDTASNLTGVSLYEPQTAPGKFAETAGEFTTGAVAGPARSGVALLKQAFKYGTVPGLVSEGAGQFVQNQLPGNPALETGARILGGMTPASIFAARAARTGMRPPAPGVDPNQRIRLAGEFKVPLTEGQATGNITQQSFEEAARHGAKGPRATQIMQEFGGRQRAAVDTAGSQVRELVQGDFAPVQGADVAGEKLTEAIRQRVAQHDAEASRLYKSSEAKGTVVDRQAAMNAPQAVAQKLAAADYPFDESIHPSAFKAMAEIERLGEIGSTSSTGISLRDVDMIRQRIGEFGGSKDPRDVKAFVLVKNAFDDWLDDSINNNLFSGSPDGLAELKAARVQSSAMKRITNPKQGDDAGQRIADMAKDGRTGQEVANWLYGSSIINPPATTVRVAQKIKGMFEQDSPEWSAIRQGAWTRVIQGSTAAEKGPQAISTAVNEFLNGQGKALSQVLYSPEERELMRRYGQTVKFLVPDPKATNPSKSSYGMAKLAQSSLRGVGAALGMATHADPLGGVGGYVVGEAIDKGTNALQNVGNAAAANRSVNPKLNAPIFDPVNALQLVGRAGLTGGQIDRPSPQDDKSKRKY